MVDEYDVPLENAFIGHFYNEMSSFIRSLFESAFKTNGSMEFAVITGCLRISKESIFTGLNNLEIHSILSKSYDAYFGFTEQYPSAYWANTSSNSIVRKLIDFSDTAAKSEIE